MYNLELIMSEIGPQADLTTSNPYYHQFNIMFKSTAYANLEENPNFPCFRWNIFTQLYQNYSDKSPWLVSPVTKQ